MAEIISIICAKAFIILLRREMFTINLGYQNKLDIDCASTASDDLSPPQVVRATYVILFSVTDADLMTTMVVELAVEFVVDYMALSKEINKMNVSC